MARLPKLIKSLSLIIAIGIIAVIAITLAQEEITLTTIMPGGVVPKGGIIMWSGTLANIPDGWALCNGANGTPNLTQKFIYGVAAGEDPDPPKTGGSTEHSHTIPNLETRFGAAGPGEGTVGELICNYYDGEGFVINGPGATTCHYYKSPSPEVYPLHSGHDELGTETGETGSENHLPPYYKLAFIMKL